MSANANQQPLNEQQIIAIYRGMQSEIRQIAEKMAELEVDIHEHTRVLETLEPLEPTRKAFRMIGGVLVERTVQEVLPAVKTNKEGISNVWQKLQEELKKKEAEASAWQQKYNIRTQNAQ